MRNRGGFTIVETLIVLGVTGVLFFATMSTISGRQGRTEFTQSMREINSRVVDALNDVNDGFYPSISNLKCSAGAGNVRPTLSYDSSVSDTVGKNAECVLAGKVLQFGVTDTDVSDTRLYSLAGRRTWTDASGTVRDVKNISELKPKVINVTDAGHALDATERNTLPSGIKLVKSDGSDDYAAIGIYYQNFGGETESGQSTGAASVSIAQLHPATYTESAVMTKAEAVSSDADFLSPAGALVLCFKSATSSQFSTITIRGGSGGFTTDLALNVSVSGASCIS